MIEKMVTDAGSILYPEQYDVVLKLNELIEASNRQDRVIALLCRNIPGGMAQYLRAVDEDFYNELGRSEEDERERDLMGSDHG